MPDYSQTPRLDARSPLVLDTRDLPRSPGAMRTVERVVPAPSDLGLELIRVPVGAELALRLRLESATEGVLVSGTVTAPLEGECGRCLRGFDSSTTVSFREFYTYPDRVLERASDETADEDEVGHMQGDLIDLEPELRDALVLALPVNPVCRDDCSGLCQECGEPWDELPAGHSHARLDPRWAALDQLKRQQD